jgi:hypothetical protein
MQNKNLQFSKCSWQIKVILRSSKLELSPILFSSEKEKKGNWFAQQILILTDLNPTVKISTLKVNMYLSFSNLILVAIKYASNILVKVNYIFKSEMRATLPCTTCLL